MSIDTLTLALWAAVTVLASVSLVYLVVSYGRADRAMRRQLEERLARGEITVDEYRTRVAVLG